MKSVLQRIERRDSETIGDDASSGRSSPRTDENAVLLREPDEVPNDQEVVRQLHIADDTQLIGQAILDIAYWPAS